MIWRHWNAGRTAGTCSGALLDIRNDLGLLSEEYDPRAAGVIRTPFCYSTLSLLGYASPLPRFPPHHCCFVFLLSIIGIHFPSGPCMSILKLYDVGESSLITTRDLTFLPPIVPSSV